MQLCSYSHKAKDFYSAPPSSTRTRLILDEQRFLPFPGSGEALPPVTSPILLLLEVPPLFQSCGWLAPFPFCPRRQSFCKVPSSLMSTVCPVIGWHCHPPLPIQPGAHHNRKALPTTRMGATILGCPPFHGRELPFRKPL